MKTIEVTYDVAKWNSETSRWEDGEAGARLDFLDDYIVGELQATLSVGAKQRYKPTSWHTLLDFLSKLEELRGRSFSPGSIKTIEVISEGAPTLYCGR